ncbi:dihydropteroate synthase [Paenibacillus contaminans]|uniref:Dihydropteroate synthase n=1 Tax=Paenibacillus contaminans TaxID=450362 RepID=A0A329LPN1_9BACL|nr:dihydropteroate synthase [Paenibacillus contaminans]RAV09669.1 dihydropteroate synthase [Paenibacillus contaminans]
MTTRTMACRELSLTLGEKTLIMGILNMTPDSFSDGGSYASTEKAIERARQMVAEGADIIDIGGESTRPGAEKVSLEEELRRVLPVIEALREAVGVPISVDTYKPEVAKRSLEAGAHIINDIWGFKDSPAMARIAAEYDCPVILMHNRTDMNYGAFVPDVIADLQESVRLALASGVRAERIILDPGIGFAKNYEHNLYLMNHLNGIVALGYPVLLGTSRKSFIQRTLQLPAEDVVEGTSATVAIGIAQGCQIIRVHDVKQMKRVAAMTEAIVHARNPNA